MPEFYDQGTCKYQKAAQPFLEAIARGVRDSARCRSFLLTGTKHAPDYIEAVPLWAEQWKRRDPKDTMKCPFWSNYWNEACSNCNCKIDLSVSMEIDAVFFLRNGTGKTLALHVEMKRDKEALSHGQAEAYRPRAACYRDGRRPRPAVIPHDDFLTILFCGQGTDLTEARIHFDRVITHTAARVVFEGY